MTLCELTFITQVSNLIMPPSGYLSSKRKSGKILFKSYNEA